MVLDKVRVAEGKPFIVAGIPAYNEEKTFAKMVLQAQKYAGRLWFVMVVQRYDS